MVAKGEVMRVVVVGGGAQRANKRMNAKLKFNRRLVRLSPGTTVVWLFCNVYQVQQGPFHLTGHC